MSRWILAPRPDIRWRDPKWWANGIFRSLVPIVALGLPLMWFQSNYRVAFDGIKGVNCVDYTMFVVDIHDKTVVRGGFYSFVANEMEPFYKKGTLALKIAAAVPGDNITVDPSGISINAKWWGPLAHVQENEKLWRMGKRAEHFVRSEVVPLGKVAMLGTNERSYDSRYWGYIDASQIQGRAYPIF
jgi:conjugal transfer pilin signal peptidase TrbI